MKKFYKSWNPRQETLAIVSIAEDIINEYQAAGYILTLRQLYYQFVSRDLIENTERSYKNLGSVISKARDAGLIDWEAIEDRNRNVNSTWSEEDPMNLIKTLPYGIQFNPWDYQDVYLEVWVEKEALGNVVSRACDKLLIPNMACKGYLSSSEAWRAGQRFEEMLDLGKHCVILHLGDHDPSGIDMTRDNKDRVSLYSNSNVVEMKRIALNIDQVEEFSPPPNPTKITDSRAKDYISKFGKTSWELDALEPSIIESLIISEASNYIDQSVWSEVQAKEKEVVNGLHDLVSRWDEVTEFLKESK